MKKFLQEMDGIDFDWFATDKSGHLAIFATAGEGIVPESILVNIELHSLIAEKIELQNWGSANVWANYAALGLFAFDWCSERGIYVKKASPNALVKFAVSLESINQLPKIEVQFNEVLEVKVKT